MKPETIGIDPEVVFDKLAQFQTADEIANYLRNEGIQGGRNLAFRCPIANYMRTHTGRKHGVTQDDVDMDTGDLYYKRENTPAIKEFIVRFDQGLYEDLIDSSISTSFIDFESAVNWEPLDFNCIDEDF